MRGGGAVLRRGRVWGVGAVGAVEVVGGNGGVGGGGRWEGLGMVGVMVLTMRRGLRSCFV